MESYVITSKANGKKLYWCETQESPVQGYWRMSKKQSTQFSKKNRAELYAKKYVNSVYIDSMKVEEF